MLSRMVAVSVMVPPPNIAGAACLGMSPIMNELCQHRVQ
jgi:hypothetical protein